MLLPPRPAATLVKHAEPRGDAADWPLDDERLTQFEIAGEFRRPITAAAALYRMLTVLTAICSVAMLVVSICLWTLVARATILRRISVIRWGPGAFQRDLLLRGAAQTRSNAAAPMTMFVLFMVITLLNLLGIYGLLRLDPNQRRALCHWRRVRDRVCDRLLSRLRRDPRVFPATRVVPGNADPRGCNCD